jgi:hypothetical protein
MVAQSDIRSEEEHGPNPKPNHPRFPEGRSIKIRALPSAFPKLVTIVPLFSEQEHNADQVDFWDLEPEEEDQEDNMQDVRIS